MRCSTGVTINSRVYARLLSFYDPPSFQAVDHPNLSDRPSVPIVPIRGFHNRSSPAADDARVSQKERRGAPPRPFPVIRAIFDRLRETPSTFVPRFPSFSLLDASAFQNWISSATRRYRSRMIQWTSRKRIESIQLLIRSGSNYTTVDDLLMC